MVLAVPGELEKVDGTLLLGGQTLSFWEQAKAALLIESHPDVPAMGKILQNSLERLWGQVVIYHWYRHHWILMKIQCCIIKWHVE